MYTIQTVFISVLARKTMFGKIAMNFCLVLVLLAASFTLAENPVFAAGCSGTGCNGKDPGITSCGTGASTITSASIYFKPGSANPITGSVEIRWSQGCKTKWAKAAVNKDTDMQVFLRDSRGNVIYDTMYGTHSASAYGQMWYSPSQLVKACVSLNGPSSKEFCTALQ